MTPNHRKLAVAALVLVALTWWLATAPESPVRPEPPRPDRPVLKFLAKAARVAARVGLTVMMFAEPQPHADEIQLARAAVGTDGHQLLDNARW